MMRLTKIKLREQIAHIQKRIKDLGNLSDDELATEMKRCFPAHNEALNVKQTLSLLSRDYIDRSFPPNWTE